MSFAQRLPWRYHVRMFMTGPGQISALRMALAILVGGGLLGAAFAAWIANGSDMLVALAASGLAWCF